MRCWRVSPLFFAVVLAGCVDQQVPAVPQAAREDRTTWESGLDWSREAFEAVVPNDQKNAVFSPYSAYQMWAIAINCSGNRAQEKILADLSGKPDLSRFNETLNATSTALKADKSLALGHAVWIEPYAIMPEHKTRLDPYGTLQSITNQEWEQFATLDGARTVSKGHLTRFRVNQSHDLYDYLRSILDRTGEDWSPVAPTATLFQAKQSAMIEVDEEGTKASAVSMMEVAKSASPSLNKPFAFAVMKKGLSLPLFVGVIYEP